MIYVCAKFEADISIRSKVIRGSQNFEIRSLDPGHAHLGVDLWSGRSWGPFSVSVPNLKPISLLYSFKSYKVSQNFEIRSRDPGHVHLGVVL